MCMFRWQAWLAAFCVSNKDVTISLASTCLVQTAECVLGQLLQFLQSNHLEKSFHLFIFSKSVP